MILVGIYITGGIPSVFYMLTGIEFFYSGGIVSVTLTVMIEKILSICMDPKLSIFFQNITKRAAKQIHPAKKPPDRQ